MKQITHNFYQKTHKRTQAGDTIVAVLMAVTVISISLAASFASANRAYQTGRAAQERFEALKLAESQIELLKNYYKNPARKTVYDAMTSATDFCIDGSQVPGAEVKPTSDPLCQNTNGTGGAGYYSVVVKPQSGGSGIFEAHVEWERFGSNKGIPETLSLFYRLGPL